MLVASGNNVYLERGMIVRQWVYFTLVDRRPRHFLEVEAV